MRIAKSRGYETVSDAARLVELGYGRKIAQRLVPGLLIPLYDVAGEVAGSTFKPDAPRTDRAGKARKYEKPTGSRNVVDCHPSLVKRLQDDEVDLWVTEGTKKADAAVSRGLCCVALSGVDNWRCKPPGSETTQPCPEWDRIPLTGRRVFIVFDSDQATNANVQRARRQLTEFLQSRGARVEWVNLPDDGEGKVGLDDYLVAGGTTDALTTLGRTPSEQEKKKPTLGESVLKYVHEHYDLFATPQGQAFAVPRSGRRRPVAFPETGGQLTADVRHRMHADTGKTISKATVADALGIAHSYALSGHRHELHIRCSASPSQIVIDLGEPETTRCLVVTQAGWAIADQPPEGVHFRLSATTLPLPVPQRDRTPGVGWRTLADILGWHRKSREFRLVRSWIACAPLAHIQRPMLMLIGAPGSGKTSRGLSVIGVWDPRPALGSSLGKNLEDDRVKANASFLLGYDNLSSFSEAQSDHIARVVTGDAPEKRLLYSDDTLHSMFYRRTGVLTAVHLPNGLKPDSLERLIPLELNRPSEFASETDLARRLAEVQPALLADALDGLVEILRRLPDLQRHQPAGEERMLDYWLSLRALGSEYAAAFSDHNRESMSEIARNDPWTKAVVRWVRSLPKGRFKGSPERGFESFVDFMLGPVGMENWGHVPESRRPRDATALSRAMSRNATPLRAAGIDFEVRRSNGRRVWIIESSVR